MGEKIKEVLERNARRDKIDGRISHGMTYARRELREEDLDYWERQKIEERVKRRLEKLTGEESDEKVEALVDEILDEELGEE